MATAVLWAAPQAQSALNGGGWALLAAWLTTPGALLPGVVAVLLAVAAGWTMRPRRDGSAPGWWGGPSVPAAPPGRGAVLVGLAAGVAGGIALAGYRAVAGPVSGDVDAIQRVDAGVLGSGLVGATVVVVLGLARGPAGAAGGLLAGHCPSRRCAPPRCWLPSPSLRARNSGDGHGCAADPRPGPVCGAARILRGRGRCGPDQPLGPAVPRGLYADVVARPLLDGRVASMSTFSALQAEYPPADVAATRIGAEILPLLRQRLDGAQPVPMDDPEVRKVHAHAIAGARLHVFGFETLVEALDQGDQQLVKQASTLLADGNAEWEQWASGVGGL